ncbi:hypothetical protein A3G50_00645 [Candidatus Jorgensenbacteria bacterium RIFCSPLOWO2_12_FULL_42_11]|uniref:phosphoribosylamine--glycine ligase n=1 Tax=Candidatus Jorgensenbacteria bacterium RIFCSPLOWO2_12_FULL_42_11 TaxID=1798473 RepID=A0A1F6C0Z8_9BACT|nr:MAG: hypothetical protein A3G50_00645 [Candidatus Jorgensenbacteria bacterium RIFCSPLOWO2_12_FULL_42_11]
MANNNSNQNGLSPKKFLFVSLESLSGDLAWQLTKEGHEVKAYIKAKSDIDVYNGFIGKVDSWEPHVSWADVICYDKKTEVLTENGWKLFEKLKYQDKIATLNPKNFRLEYHFPDKIIKYKYKGKLIYYQSPENEFCVTPDHQMFVKDYKGGYSFVAAEKIFGNTRKHIKLDCFWQGKSSEEIEVPDCQIKWKSGRQNLERKHIYSGFRIGISHLLAIAGFYISEGAVIRRWRQLNGIRFYQNYGVVLEIFKKILKEANISYRTTRKGKGEEIRIYNGALAKFLVDNFGEGTFNKHVPKWIKKIDNKNLRILYEWLMNGDGHRGRHHDFYSSKSLQLLDDVQEILLKIGLAGRTKKNIISIIKNKNCEPRLKDKKYWKKIDYNDYVYCVEVSNHILYVRKNGKPMWCGNCFDDVEFGEIADKLRRKGKLVIGGSIYTDRLEMDREFGQLEMKKYGINILPQWQFSNYDEAIEFIRKNPERYVFKPGGNTPSTSKGLLFLGEEEDGKDILELLERNKEIWKKKAPVFQLQKYVSGVEVATGAFFNGKDFIMPINVNFEHKKIFPGDIGPMAGEMGTLMFWNRPNNLFIMTLEKMKPALAESGYIGYIDINCIVNSKGIYPLEWTARFGYPTIHIQSEGILTPMGEFLFRLAKGEYFELKTKRGFQLGVRILSPHYFAKNDRELVEMYRDLPILFKKPDNLEGVHIEDIKRVEGVWRIAGESGCLLVITGSGSTVAEAREQAYSRIKNIMIQNMAYRTDIGLKWNTDSDKLQTWGYLY